MGLWPPMIEKPKIEYLGKKRRESFTRHQVRVEIAPEQQTVNGYLLVPDGAWLFPAMLVVYYGAEANRQVHSPTPESNEQIYLFLEHFLAIQQ
jgi:hypothetical protein